MALFYKFLSECNTLFLKLLYNFVFVSMFVSVYLYLRDCIKKMARFFNSNERSEYSYIGLLNFSQEKTFNIAHAEFIYCGLMSF